jgi:hypothetical protein
VDGRPDAREGRTPLASAGGRGREPASILTRLAKTTHLGRVLALPLRARLAARYTAPGVVAALRWLATSREYTNFTYDLHPRNLRHLASFVAHVAGRPVAEVEGYIGELLGDEALRAHVQRATRASAGRWVADAEVRYGRRAGWYAFVRALKPRVVVETGVDKGLGSVVLCAALARNAEAGAPGRHYGTDIDPAAGYLLQPPYSGFGTVLYGDSVESLRQLQGPVDLFINDSDHSAAYERREYEAIAPRLAPRALVLGDNAHVTDELRDFALRTGRDFLYFQERPLGHWYPGGGIGVAMPRDGLA